MRKGMHGLRRNMTDFEYLPADGTMSDLNGDGEHTGEFYPVYGDPVPMRGNISLPGGAVRQELFGTDIRYTHVLVMDDPEADIRETGIIRWKGKEYAIRAVRPSLNVISIALMQKTGDANA